MRSRHSKFQLSRLTFSSHTVPAHCAVSLPMAGAVRISINQVFCLAGQPGIRHTGDPKTQHTSCDFEAAVVWRCARACRKHLAHTTDDPGRTRTCNLWFRRPTPYPLGHRASAQVLPSHQLTHSTAPCSEAPQVVAMGSRFHGGDGGSFPRSTACSRASASVSQATVNCSGAHCKAQGQARTPLARRGTQPSWSERLIAPPKQCSTLAWCQHRMSISVEHPCWAVLLQNMRPVRIELTTLGL